MVYGAIWESSLAERWEATVMMMALLSLADQEDIVWMGAERLSYKTRLPIEVVTAGLTAMLREDPSSRSQSEGGRRIVQIPYVDGTMPDPMELNPRGFFIVNRSYYKNLARTSYMRTYMQKRRAQKKDSKRLAAASRKAASALAELQTEAEKETP